MANDCSKPNLSFEKGNLKYSDENGNCRELRFKVNQSGLTKNAIKTLILRYAHIGPIYFFDASTGDWWKFDVSQDGLGNMEQTNIGPNLPPPLG